MEINGLQSRPGSSLPERIGRRPLVRLQKGVRGLSGITLPGKAGWAMPANVSPERKRILRAQELARKNPQRFREEE